MVRRGGAVETILRRCDTVTCRGTSRIRNSYRVTSLTRNSYRGTSFRAVSCERGTLVQPRESQGYGEQQRASERDHLAVVTCRGEAKVTDGAFHNSSRGWHTVRQSAPTVWLRRPRDRPERVRDHLAEVRHRHLPRGSQGYLGVPLETSQVVPFSLGSGATTHFQV